MLKTFAFSRIKQNSNTVNLRFKISNINNIYDNLIDSPTTIFHANNLFVYWSLSYIYK